MTPSSEVANGVPADLKNAPEALSCLVGLGWDLVATHGNGPQVGARLLAAPGTIPLDVLDAETQGSLGYLLQQALGNALKGSGLSRSVVSLVTQVVVDPHDPAFARPTKPVGPFYSREQAGALGREKGWAMVEDSGRGYRRVVPSPEPLEIVEWRAIRALLAAGVVVVAAGGGGIPVIRRADLSLEGIEAVIDKDRASSLLARLLGADLFVIFTSVSEVYLDYRTPSERGLRRLSVHEARRLLSEGQFAAGSMGPKVEAAAAFSAATGRPTIITSAHRVLDALAGTAGTTVHP
jgi:carbamate kinase